LKNSKRHLDDGISMDTQQIGIIGKHILIANLIAADLEVAEPIRDHGIDLIAFRDRVESGEFLACPIQLKTATDEVFGLDSKYENFSGLRIVFVWNARNPVNAEIFVLSYEEASIVLSEMKYDKTKSWEDGKYTTTRPSEKLKKILKEKFQVTDPKEWPRRLGMKIPSAIP
jgi:hypothetical protein